MQKALEGMPRYRITIEELESGDGSQRPMSTVIVQSRDLGVVQHHTGLEFSRRVQFDVYSRDFDISANGYGRTPRL